MTISRFKVYWRFDGTTQGTVEIDRQVGTFKVRAHRRHKSFELPLAFVAEIVATRCIKAEIMAKKKEKLARRRGR